MRWAADIRAFTYDGDTPQDARKAIRERANVVLTNPGHAAQRDPAAPHQMGEMLRESALLRHRRAALLSRRVRQPSGEPAAARLKRICEFYGSTPQFICCSATIANPKELAEALTGLPFELVERNGAPSGEKYFVFYNPPVVNRQLGIRRSYIHETRRIALEFIERDSRRWYSPTTGWRPRSC